MATYNRLTYLATSGNRAVKAAGEPVWTAYGLNVYSGELVVFNPKTNLTVAAVDVLNQDRVSVAVGVGTPGRNATSLRYLAGEDFNLCSATIDADVTAPTCAVPQMVDVFFDCTKCDETYTMEILLDDSLVRSRYNVNEKAKYIYTAATECGGCDDCETEAPCSVVQKSIVDQINLKYNDDPTTAVYFQRRNPENQYQPFRALPLFNSANSVKEYCLPLSDGMCQDCEYISGGIYGITIGETDFDFVAAGIVGNTTPDQIPGIIKQINAAFESAGVSGYAHATRGLHNCCNLCIQISSGTPFTLLDFEEGEIVPSAQYNPFTVAESTLTCGFRVIADPVTVDCLCDWPANLPVPNYYGRTVEIHKVGEGWVKDNFSIYNAQAQVLPEGFGYFYQDKERYQHNGGNGRDYRYSNRKVGIIGLPDKFSRDSNTTINCQENYCVYNILSTATKNLRFNNAFSVTNTDASWVLIPSGDDVTQISWETYLSELNKNGLCITTDVACFDRLG